MFSRFSGIPWPEEDGGGAAGAGENASAPVSYPVAADSDAKDELGLPSFKSLLDDDWLLGPDPSHPDLRDFAFPSDPFLLPHPHHTPIDSSSSLPPPPFFLPKSALSSLLASGSSANFDPAFTLGATDPAFLSGAQMPSSSVLGIPELGPGCQSVGSDLGLAGHFPTTHLPILGGNASDSGSTASLLQLGFDCFQNSAFASRSKLLQPLEIFPPVGAQPNLFQKRAATALCRNPVTDGGQKSVSEEDDMVEPSIDPTDWNYDSGEAATENADSFGDAENDGGGNDSSHANSTVSVDGTGKGKKKKGMPAKNLMAERRRRKKLNDRLYMLRSVVPKISKMDRASILGDAIEYLKELLQRINDLHNELEATPSGLLMPATSVGSFHPPTPTPQTLPCRVKDELCPSSLPSPASQQARVEVRIREGRAVNIHMFCSRRPGLLLSTMRALDNLGLDIQQAVISCFNGFALDVFRAEQGDSGPGVLPEEIKSVLMHSAGIQNEI